MGLLCGKPRAGGVWRMVGNPRGFLYHGRHHCRHSSQRSIATITLHNKPLRTQRLQTSISGSRGGQGSRLDHSGLGEAPAHDLGVGGLSVGLGLSCGNLALRPVPWHPSSRLAGRALLVKYRCQGRHGNLQALSGASAPVRTCAKLRTQGWGNHTIS